MSYEPGVPDRSITAVSQPSKMAFYFVHYSKGTVKPSAESVYNWDPLQAIETPDPTTPKGASIELSEIAVYFADRFQADIQPSEISTQNALQLRISELSKELERSQNAASEWQARAVSYNIMKVDWDLAYETLHQSMRDDLLEISEDAHHLANSIRYLNDYEKRTIVGVQEEVAKFMSLINSELNTTEQEDAVARESAACIRQVALHIGPLLMEFNKMVGESRRQSYNENATAAEKKRLLNIIVNKDISTVLLNDLDCLKVEILGFFDRKGLQKLKTKPHEIVKYNNLEGRLSCIKTRLAIYTGKYEEIVSQIIERHQAEIIQKCRDGVKKLVDAKISLGDE